MSLHNALALEAARSLVRLVQAGGAWRQVFSGEAVSLGYLHSTTRWPLPDAILIDGKEENRASYCALEFKPPQSSKGECVRGLGQAITYLADYESAALILPDRASDGYQIAQHIAGLISRPIAAQERVGVYSYHVDRTISASNSPIELQLLKPIGGFGDELSPSEDRNPERTFWAFWRDTSLHEIFITLDHADRLAGERNTRDLSLDHLYREYSELRTLDPQGNARRAAGITERDFKGHTAVTLNHLNLWEDDGILTLAGRHLVHVGRLFGATSAPFRDAFAQQSLLVGRHYEFVKLVYEFQRNSPGQYRRAEEFAVALETYLEDEGLLRRLPRRRTTGSRRFLKAELTYWGVMLGIIKKRGASYVVPGVGLDFNWPRILDLLAGSAMGG